MSRVPDHAVAATGIKPPASQDTGFSYQPRSTDLDVTGGASKSSHPAVKLYEKRKNPFGYVTGGYILS